MNRKHKNRPLTICLALLGLLLLMFPGTSLPQGYRDLVRMGDDVFALGDYYSAAHYYRSALEMDSSRIKLIEKYAEASRLAFDYDEALNAYRTLVGLSGPDKSEENVFWYAMMLKSNGRYSEAGEAFSKYIAASGDPKSELMARARQEEGACRKATEIMQDTISVRILPLGNRINSPFSEFAAREYKDSLLLFSSLQAEDYTESEDFDPDLVEARIYAAKKTFAGYGKPILYDKRINLEGYHNVNLSFNEDYTELVFSRCEESSRQEYICRLFQSSFRKGKWSKPLDLGDLVNDGSSTQTQPTITSADGYDILYFISDRPGGFGGLDIWYSIIKKGVPAEPVNLGKTINTPGNESSPYYDAVQKTLYFSSDWHYGLGGYDVFSSQGGLNQWESPANLGFPVNSTANDLYYYLRNDSTGFFSSNREGSNSLKDETCCYDIYEFSYFKRTPALGGNLPVTTKETRYSRISELLPVSLYFDNDHPDPGSRSADTKADYRDLLADYLSKKEEFIERYSGTGKNSVSGQGSDEVVDFFDKEVEGSFAGLEELLMLLFQDLENGASVTLTLKGYASPLTSEQYNLILTQRRIKSFLNFLGSFRGGIFLSHLNRNPTSPGSLRIIQEPFGESKAGSGVSDNPTDLRNAVYSPAASRERRLEITTYGAGNQEIRQRSDSITEISFSSETHNFGAIAPGQRMVHSFIFKNTGKGILLLKDVQASCGCTNLSWNITPIKPGETGMISLLFDSHNLTGIQAETITVYGNFRGGHKILYIYADVENRK